MIVMKVSPERKDLYIQTLMDQLCGAHEENLFLLEELSKAQEQLKSLFKENSMLRHRLQEAGLEVEAGEKKDSGDSKPVSK